jgi:CRISPR-associated protein Cas6/Cse3/CasE subtype I-E
MSRLQWKDSKRIKQSRADCEQVDYYAELRSEVVSRPSTKYLREYGLESGMKPLEKSGRLSAVQFDGVLVVTDPDKLSVAVRNGIGPQKAFGFGLLSLAPLRD